MLARVKHKLSVALADEVMAGAQHRGKWPDDGRFSCMLMLNAYRAMAHTAHSAASHAAAFVEAKEDCRAVSASYSLLPRTDGDRDSSSNACVTPAHNAATSAAFTAVPPPRARLPASSSYFSMGVAAIWPGEREWQHRHAPLCMQAQLAVVVHAHV